MHETIALSESAVAVLRFRVKGWRWPVRDSNRDAFRELVAAGIMERDGEDYRFTEAGKARCHEVLAEAEEQLARDRYNPPDGDLSEAARERLRRYLEGDRAVTEENRPAYRELVAARVMIPVHAFVGGREAEYRLTYWGYQRRFELAGLGGAEETA